MAKQTEPRKVTKVPEGYKEEVRDGKTVYVKKTEKSKPAAPSISTSKIKSTPVKKVTGASVKPSVKSVSKPKPPESSFDEDVVILDQPTPVVPPTPVIQKQQSLRTDTKEVFTGGLPKGIHQYQVPDLNTGGNYTKQKNVFTDEEGNPVQFDFKTNQYIKTGEPNFRSSMPVLNDTPTIQAPLKEGELPTKFDVVPERLRTQQYNAPKVVAPTVDTTQYKGFNELDKTTPLVPTDEFQKEQEKNLAIPKLNKGGLVGKVMGKYAVGGNVNYNEFGNNNIGVIGQNDPYAAQKKEEEKTKNSQNAKDAAGLAGKVLGAAGSTYYNSQTPTSNEDATRNAGLATASNMGAIGGIIGGAAALGDKIGKNVKKDSQAMDEKGNLLDANSSRRNAIGGSLFSPTKALAYRKESGNWFDVTGKDYNKFIEGKAKKQLAKVEDTNKQDKIRQAIEARDANNFNPTETTLYDTNGVTFDASSQQMTLANDQQFDPNRRYAKGGLVGKVMQSCANGGVIKGKGTGKSDSITAKVEAGSFIVPAENAPVAEMLRAKFLGKPPKVKAGLNDKGGELVKLSNGEHKFSKEEKQELLNRGVNVDLLAPNSEEKAVKKNMIQFPKVVGYKDGGLVKGTKVDGAIWDGKNWVSANGSKYTSEKGKQFTEKYNQSVQKAKSNEETKRQSEINVYTRKLGQAKESGNDAEAKRLQDKINSLTGKVELTPSEVKSVSKSEVKVPKGTKIAPKTVTKTTVDLPSKNLSLTGLREDAALRQGKAETTQDAAINAVSGTTPTSTTTTVTNPQAKRTGLGGLAGRIDPTMLAGVGQTALGLNMLKNEVRPIDQTKLDPTYNQAVNRAQEDAKFGFTPEQNFALEQARQNAVNDSRYSARNFAGGNAGTAFNQERQAINQGWMAKLGLANENQQLRMEKQRYADAQAQNRGNINMQLSKNAFNNAMDTFQQKQQAGSELIGAGINNTIGALRYQQELDAMEKADKERNKWLGSV